MLARYKSQHECEVLEGGHVAAESEIRWKECKKNPGHKNFIPLQDFMDELSSSSALSAEQRDCFRTIADLTVRIRVQHTSLERPQDDQLSEYRGTDRLRTGTGFIYGVSGSKSNEPCSCGECDGKIARTSFLFYVRTAHHVIYNTEEARKTRFDLFYDDESCHLNGRIKTARAVEVMKSYSDCDVSEILCVTHDETLANRIESLDCRRYSFVDCDLHSTLRPKKLNVIDCFREFLVRAGPDLAFIISHPHCQPKKITVGKGIRPKNRSADGQHHGFKGYNAATCPGSSGAPVFHIPQPVSTNRTTSVQPTRPYSRTVHSGTFHKTFFNFLYCVNYGNHWS